MLSVLASTACRDRAPPRDPPLASSIARELTLRFGAPATTRCDLAAPTPTCSAKLLDGAPIALAITADGSGYAWRVVDPLVDVAQVEVYVDQLLAARKVAQTAKCAGKLARAPTTLVCALSGGGAAFVAVGASGELSVELALDAAAAGARGEALTPERDKELEQKSRALDRGDEGQHGPHDVEP